MVVHDMRSPLLAVLINLENVKRQATALDEDSRESLRMRLLQLKSSSE